MVHAALNGSLTGVSTHVDPIFGVAVPETCPEVPNEVLDPRRTWTEGVEYDEQALRVARLFQENFITFNADVSQAIRSAGPQAG